jgi:hypothetical protein
LGIESGHTAPVLNAVRIWILLSTLVVSCGWVLSAFHALFGATYCVIFALAAVTFVAWQRHAGYCPPKYLPHLWRKFRQRIKRPAPLIFLMLVLLALAGGALYAPANGSSAAYRIPRVMDWLAAGQWQWIRAMDVRLNIAGSGMEWFFAPLILLTRNDRLLFLPNWFSFLLLPGLIYSVFTRLGVRRRVAWWWMWLLPSGWCFIMQAGSTLNDSFATVYALASVDFALRARENRSVGEIWLSLLSAALATGVKQSDVLLAIPGLIAIVPSIRLLWDRPFPSAVVGAICLPISALPTIFFNLKHTGNWAGLTKAAWGNAELHSPFWGLLGNAFCMTAQNLKPPAFPIAGAWNAAMVNFLQTPFGAHFQQFEDFGRMSFGVGESAAALGAGIVLLTLLSLFAARHYQKALRLSRVERNSDELLTLLRWIPWALLVMFMAKIGTYENGRQFASHYFLLFPSLLYRPGHSILVRQRWWKIVAVLVMAMAAGLLFVSRDRPLFPAQMIIGRLAAKHPDSKLVSNIARTYGETPAFEQGRANLRKILPQDTTVLGYAAWVNGDLGSSLWMPYGQRRIEYVLPDDTADQMQMAGIQYVVVEGAFLDGMQSTLAQWLARYHAVLVTQWDIIMNPYEPPKRYYLVRLPYSPRTEESSSSSSLNR